ncbi:MAG: dicarboxylate/amino acid:cation symporter [Verrucomicrobia bacterium]|nr:dicarboxylate/amino acid:cation symporter [Verrucomicrobiota bacterium]
MTDHSPQTQVSRWPLHTRILAGLVLGAILGISANQFLGGDHGGLQWTMANLTEPAGQLFLRLLLMVVVPLVFSSLVCGVAGIGDFRRLGRVGIKSFTYCLGISLISVGIGIGLVNIVQPGKRIPAETSQALQERYGKDASQRISVAQQSKSDDAPLLQLIKTLVPANPISAVATDSVNLLHLMFFALILGAAAAAIPGGKAGPFLAALEGLASVCARVIDWIMRLAPYAVACLVFNNLARFGLDLLQALFWYVFVVLVGLALHMFGVYSLALRFLARRDPVDFFRRVRSVIITAFSTSSSVATLPTTLRVSEEQLGVPKEINSFVLTVGATANQNGTALYEGVTVLFLAQLAGLDLSLSQQLSVAGMAILGSVGTAGLPSASIPFVVVVISSIGINPALIAIVLGVDRILDMCRTVVNVVGDMTAAVFVAREESR